jgi:hypothetical protein
VLLAVHLLPQPVGLCTDRDYLAQPGAERRPGKDICRIEDAALYRGADGVLDFLLQFPDQPDFSERSF